MKFPKFEYLYCYYHDHDTSVKSHYHNCYELTYFCDGNSESDMNGVTYKCNAGNFLIYPPHCVHNERHFKKVKVLCLGFTIPDDDGDLVTDRLYGNSNNEVLELLELIQRELQNKNAETDFYCTCLVGQLLVIVKRQSLRLQNYDNFSTVFKYLNDHYNEEIDLKELALLSGYSYDRFRHIFKLKTDTTPLNYILQKKISYAKVLLSNSTIDIKNIALSCGFANISQFSVTFKKMTGITPSQYRKNKFHEHS